MSQSTSSIITLEDLRHYRADIIKLAQQRGAFNVRVFGSLAQGEATEQSDVDFLVTFREGSNIFDQVGLWQDLQDLLGCSVDLLADHPSAGPITAMAREAAIPL